MSNIEIVIVPKVKDLGDNFEVRRSLPYMKKRMVGPFIFWDHMGPVKLVEGKDMTVRAHPHIGLATITWLFSGEILHRDSLGNEQPIRPGEVNWMTAGKGITHSERSFAKNPPQTLEGIQLWLALPKEHEDVDPSFFHCKSEDIPQINIPEADLLLVAGSAYDCKSPVPVYSDLFYLNGVIKEESKFSFDLKKNHEGAVYIIDGELEIEGKVYERFNLISFKQGTSIDVKALRGGAKIMIFGGEVFPEKRFIWWNFVSTSEEKIEQAKLKWKNQEFSKVYNEDESVFTPLPEY